MNKWVWMIPCLLGCGKGADVRVIEKNAVSVEATTIAREEVGRTIRASGFVRAKQSIDLGFKGAGIVERVFVDEGTKVKKGQMLAKLDATEYVAGASQAKDTVDKLERDLARAKRLESNGAIGRVETEDATTRLDVARATLSQANYNVARTAIVAPEDGWILRRFAEPGEVVGPGRPILSFEGRGRGKVVRASLVDKEALSLELGSRCELKIDARPDLALEAAVSEIGRDVSKATGLVEVEAKFEGADALPEGLSAKLACNARKESALVVPIEALFDEQGDRAAVFVVDEGELVHRTPVAFEPGHDGKVVLRDGALERKRVVTRGAAYLHDGEKVEIAALDALKRTP